MNKQKLTYLSPVTETLVVRFEGVICQSEQNLAMLFSAIENTAGAAFSSDNINSINDDF